MPNQLVGETSPYLLQHASNPVNWWPWGSEALQRARDENKPIFLSIGYSACHWCHVMEHESFENKEIAATLNEHFVSIKVDREERPDLDQIYMNAVQMITGRGGWPMSVFLTPALKPFFGGTYWPPHSRMGMPGFDQVLSSITRVWAERRDEAEQQAEELTGHLQQAGPISGSGRNPDLELLHDAAVELQRSADGVRGGFGNAPKFPHSMSLQLLLHAWHRRPHDELLQLVRLNLDKMSRGGIYDHLAGGFSRYSVDADWLVPHFEKMLYDNALLTDVYLDGFLVTTDPEYARIARETLDYQLHYMTDPQGGFHSSEDADSEGVEGKFYVWTPEEIRQVLGNDAAERFCTVYDVTPAGNFEGHNILNLPHTIGECAKLHDWDEEKLQAELVQSRNKLLEVRDRRERPAKDDKILVNWNGLMIHSMARASGILDEETYLTAAASAANFLLEHVRREDGRLLHSWRSGQARIDAFLDDYANLINALVTLYEQDFDETWIDEAVPLAEMLLEHFHDDDAGGFFYTADDHEELITRIKDTFDNATPSSNAMAATALLRLGKLCGKTAYLQAAAETLQLGTAVMERSAIAGSQLLLALDMQIGPTPEIVLLGHSDELLQDLRQRFLPNHVLCGRTTVQAVTSEHLKNIFAGKPDSVETPTVFVCENFACQAPVSGEQAIRETWDKLTAHPTTPDSN